MGCAGRVANGINTVYLSYVREKTGTRWPGRRGLRKQLPIGICAGAYADGPGFDFICRDEVCRLCSSTSASKRSPPPHGQHFADQRMQAPSPGKNPHLSDVNGQDRNEP